MNFHLQNTKRIHKIFLKAFLRYIFSEYWSLLYFPFSFFIYASFDYIYVIDWHVENEHRTTIDNQHIRSSRKSSNNYRNIYLLSSYFLVQFRSFEIDVSLIRLNERWERR